MKARASSLLLSIFFLLSFPRYLEAQTVPDTSKQNQPVVRVVCVIPSDRSYRRDYADALEQVIQNVRVWYQLQMGGKTIALAKPVVEVGWSVTFRSPRDHPPVQVYGLTVKSE